MYRLYLLMTVLFLSLGVSFAAPKKQSVPIHEDWFSVKFDDVREATVIKNKDPYGVGNIKFSDDDSIKLAISTSFKGDTVDETTPMAITITFSRLAGTCFGEGGDYQSASGDSKFKPKKQFLLYFKDCKDIIFMLPNGKKVQAKKGAVSYKTNISNDIIGSGYLWEILSIKCDLNFLKKLQDGAKGVIGEEPFVLDKDAISEVRSFLSIIGQLDE